MALSGLYYEANAKDNTEIENLVASVPERLCMAVRKGDLENIASETGDMITAILDSTLFDILDSFEKNLMELQNFFAHIWNKLKIFSNLFVHPENQIFFCICPPYIQMLNIFLLAICTKHARLTPYYLADMADLKIKDPETWTALETGEISSVFKSDIPFCGLGVDEGLEQEIRNLKIAGGVVGITQNESA